MNDLCIINGDYTDFKDLSEVLKSYSTKFKFKLHYSNDGKDLMQNYYDLHEFNEADQLDEINVDSMITLKRTNVSDNFAYTCFFLNDFDSQSKIFTKLEEVQTRYSNNQHRIIIYGIPILRSCNLNDIVSRRAMSKRKSGLNFVLARS
jgi:hypothetical protein